MKTIREKIEDVFRERRELYNPEEYGDIIDDLVALFEEEKKPKKNVVWVADFKEDTPAEDWEKEFDKEFGIYFEMMIVKTQEKVIIDANVFKDFIRTLLAKERETPTEITTTDYHLLTKKEIDKIRQEERSRVLGEIEYELSGLIKHSKGDKDHWKYREEDVKKVLEKLKELK
jgi:hypothetical protein